MGESATILAIIFATLMCGWAYIFRDGEPSYKNILAPTNPLYHFSTQLARITGAVICTIGLAPIYRWQALILGASILLSFYSDMKHGEGQGATSLKDAAYLTLSGVTSLVPIAGACAWLLGWQYGAVLIVGLLKPGIWFATAPFPRFFMRLNMYTTEAAAGIFGAAIGLSIALLG